MTSIILTYDLPLVQCTCLPHSALWYTQQSSCLFSSVFWISTSFLELDQRLNFFLVKLTFVGQERLYPIHLASMMGDEGIIRLLMLSKFGTFYARIPTRQTWHGKKGEEDETYWWLVTSTGVAKGQSYRKGLINEWGESNWKREVTGPFVAPTISLVRGGKVNVEMMWKHGKRSENMGKGGTRYC